MNKTEIEILKAEIERLKLDTKADGSCFSTMIEELLAQNDLLHKRVAYYKGLATNWKCKYEDYKGRCAELSGITVTERKYLS